MARAPKYIFIVGGVISGVGKGTIAASLAKLLQAKGYRVTAVKCDPYVNVDAGTMNPTEHGEVFVTADGMETDQDVGTYERFLDTTLTKDNYMTTGQVYLSVINRERELLYDGKCVEVVPHIPLEVIRRIKLAQSKHRADITIVEIGGTVGEYQNLLFLEAARMMHLKNPQDVLTILVSYLPIPAKLGEMKSKPTQYAARSLNEAGIQPNFIVCRAERPLDRVRREKISIFTSVQPDAVISAPDVVSVYQVPVNLERERFAEKVLRALELSARRADLKKWAASVRRGERATQEVKIGIVGKYFGVGAFTLADSYISVIEAIHHAAAKLKAKPAISWLDAEVYERDPRRIEELQDFSGIIVPGGFGSRGVLGKIAAIQYAREQEIPFFGLCYGMQLATVEFARHVAGMEGAHTTEVSPRTHFPVIDLLPEQGKLLREKHYGGSMRLGSYTCELVPHTKAARAYGKWHVANGTWQMARGRNPRRQSHTLRATGNALTVVERHRHRYEFSNVFRKRLEHAGLVISGVHRSRPESSKILELAEIIELQRHPWFLGTQFHPEFSSHFLSPHPLYLGFLEAAMTRSRQRTQES